MQDSKSYEDRLQTHVHMLADQIGERNYRNYGNLQRAEMYITRQFQNSGYEVIKQSYSVQGQEFSNIEVVLSGTQNQKSSLVMGAHYDSVTRSPGANDNASGVASLLVIADYFAQHPLPLPMRFVAFANEEPPFFQTSGMGSLRYAKDLRARDEQMIGMISLETIGYFSDEKDSQNYPPGITARFPKEGNFISLVANQSSEDWLNKVAGAFAIAAQLPSEAGVFPESLMGVGWSDHWAFWQNSYPALMITDTAPFRYPHYHTPHDTFDKISYPHLAKVTAGLIETLQALGEFYSEKS
jgi:Zn-dependent M28 family amino/carboxypeptidase